MLIVGLAVLSLGMNWLAATILVPLTIFFIYSFMKMPWEEIAEKETEKRQKLQKTKVGRIRNAFTKFFDYFSLISSLVFGLILLAALFLKVFANGS